MFLNLNFFYFGYRKVVNVGSLSFIFFLEKDGLVILMKKKINLLWFFKGYLNY